MGAHYYHAQPGKGTPLSHYRPRPGAGDDGMAGRLPSPRTDGIAGIGTQPRGMPSPVAASRARVAHRNAPEWDIREALTNGEEHARGRMADPRDEEKPHRIRGSLAKYLEAPLRPCEAVHVTPHRPLERGRQNYIRDVVDVPKLMPWRKSDAQQALLSNASHAERAIYSRVSQGLYTCKSVRGGSYDIPALLHGLDARKCGKITAKAFVGVLTRSANVALSREDARHLAAVLDTDGSGAVDVEYFLALFSDDQDYLPNEDTPSFVSAPPGAAGAEYPARTPHRSAYKSPAVEESALPRTPTNMRALVASPAGGQQQQAGGGGGGGQYLDDPALARDAHIRKMLKEAGRPDDPECIKLWRTCRKIMARLDGCHSDGPTVAERVQRADRKGCGVLKASELHRVLRDAGVQLTAPEFDCVAALFRPHGRGARPGEVDSAEFCKVFDLAVWAKDPAQRPDGDRGGRAEAAAEAFAIENEQRHLLRNAPSADWALFKKIKTRFAEIGLTADLLHLHMDLDHDGGITCAEFDAGLRRCGVSIGRSDVKRMFGLFDPNHDGVLDVAEFARLCEVNYPPGK